MSGPFRPCAVAALEALLAVARRLVAADNETAAHREKWPEWWSEDDSFAEGSLDRPANVEWSQICKRHSEAKNDLVAIARRCVVHDDCAEHPELGAECIAGVLE